MQENAEEKPVVTGTYFVRGPARSLGSFPTFILLPAFLRYLTTGGDEVSGGHSTEGYNGTRGCNLVVTRIK